MRNVTTSNFGLLIAHLLPGSAVLWGVGYLSETVRSWLGTTSAGAPTIGGFLYVTLASVAAGLTVSTVRWLVVDTLHHWTGVPRPGWDFSRLQANILAFDLIVEHQYRHYQFYSNTLVSLLFVYVARHLSLGYPSGLIDRIDMVIVALECIFFLGSRDTYRKYVSRGEMLLGGSGPAEGSNRRRSSARRPQDQPGGATASPGGHCPPPSQAI